MSKEFEAFVEIHRQLISLADQLEGLRINTPEIRAKIKELRKLSEQIGAMIVEAAINLQLSFPDTDSHGA